MCPPTLLQQAPDITAVTHAAAAAAKQQQQQQHFSFPSLLSLPLVQQQLGPGQLPQAAPLATPPQPPGMAQQPQPGKLAHLSLQQQHQHHQQQQQRAHHHQQQAQQQAQQNGGGGGLAGADASWMHMGGGGSGAAAQQQQQALLSGGFPLAPPNLPPSLAAPPNATGLAELQLQLGAVQAQVVAQQQFIRSLHKWAGSTAAAVRQVQDQFRAASAGVKRCEGQVTDLRGQLVQMSKQLDGKDAKIEGLVQELSDVKAQLVEVERFTSELRPPEKRRRLLPTESKHDPTLHPLKTDQADGEAHALGATLAAGEVAAHAATSFTTDNNNE